MFGSHTKHIVYLDVKQLTVFKGEVAFIGLYGISVSILSIVGCVFSRCPSYGQENYYYPAVQKKYRLLSKRKC